MAETIKKEENELFGTTSFDNMLSQLDNPFRDKG